MGGTNSKMYFSIKSTCEEKLPLSECLISIYTLHYRISITDALACKQSLNVAAGEGYKLIMFHIVCKIIICNEVE